MGTANAVVRWGSGRECEKKKEREKKDMGTPYLLLDGAKRACKYTNVYHTHEYSRNALLQFCRYRFVACHVLSMGGSRHGPGKKKLVQFWSSANKNTKYIYPKVGMCPSIVIDADFAYAIVECGVLGLVLACIYYPPQSKVSRVEMTSSSLNICGKTESV